MAFCENCGQEVADGDEFCGNCGAPVVSETVVISKSNNIVFCEECGAENKSGDPFCEVCGTKFSIPEKPSKKGSSTGSKNINPDVFKGSWKENWSAWANETLSEGNELGIIMTRQEELLSQLNCSESEYKTFLFNYINMARERGINYCYLNLDDNSVSDDVTNDVQTIIDVLTEIVNVARPKYLFILGNEEVVDVATWDNQSYDNDPDVYSDLAYALLDGTSPWEGQNFNLTQAIRVGRLPSYSGESITKFCEYFVNVLNADNIKDFKTYGLSAKVWREESVDEYKHFAKGNVLVCPQVTENDVSGTISDTTNLFFFNLHGSDNTKEWYGQEGSNYPKAFNPSILRNHSTPYFLGVEACYGARYVGGLTADDSILLSCLQGKCLAFFGSSKIAYGTSAPVGCCADVVVTRFLKCITDGETAGDAYIEALKDLSSGGSMDDSEIKTFAEFNLYGDPSVCSGKNKNVGKLGKFMKGFGGAPKGLKVPLPDIRKAVHLVEAEVEQKVSVSIDDYVAKNFMPSMGTKGFNMDEIFAKTEQLTNTGLYVKTYQDKSGSIDQIVKVYFNEKGSIKKTLLSK